MEMDNEKSKYEINLSKWKSFLKPIKGENVESQETLRSEEMRTDLKCLSGQVARKLTKIPNPIGCGKQSQGSQYKQSDDQLPMEDGPSTTDLSTSLSKWKLETFAKYVYFNPVVERLEIKDQLVADACPFKSEEINSLYNDIHGMFGDQTLESFIIGETQARMAIDRPILAVCKKLHIQFKLEQTIKFHYLPTGRLDYYFLSAKKPLGCIEAKSPNTLDKDAFSQAVMELLLVQELGERSKSGKAFFCILSDGIRYVLMQIMGDKLYLEHEGDGEDAVIKVRSLQESEDFKNLITSICYLIEEAKNSL